jgi:hypothetical protein
VVTEGRAPAEDYDLPEEVRRMVEWDRAAEPAALLARTEDAAFYGLAGEEDRVLLRWGQTLAEFNWSYQTPRTVALRLRQVDADGDGAEELAVVCYYGSGTGVSIEQLHIVEKNEDGTLTVPPARTTAAADSYPGAPVETRGTTFASWAGSCWRSRRTESRTPPRAGCGLVG